MKKIIFTLVLVVIMMFNIVISSFAYNSSCKADESGWYDVEGVRHMWPADMDVSGFFDGDYFVFKQEYDSLTRYVFVDVVYDVRVGSCDGLLLFFQYDSSSSVKIYPYLYADVSDSGVQYKINSTTYSCFYVSYGSAVDDLSKTRSNFLNSDLLFSTVDLYDYDSPDSLFFHPAEPPILATVVAPVKMEAVMLEVLKILPIGLACLVGFAALRKGLKLLQRMLYQA